MQWDSMQNKSENIIKVKIINFHERTCKSESF